MDLMETDDGPPKRTVPEFSVPPPPGTMINQTPADILHELSKLEPFDATTCSWPDFADRLQEHFDLYNVASEKRVRILIDRISNATYEKLSEICKPEAPLHKSFDELWTIMDTNFNKYSNKFKERVKFNRRYQRAHESVAKYATELRRWGRNCKFPESWWQEALTTQFINGIRSDVIRTKLFDRVEDDFDQLVSFASDIEAMLESLKAATESAKATESADAETKADEEQTSATTESPAAKKKKANKNQTEGTTQVADKQPTQNKNQPAQSKPKNKNKNQVKKQNANQFKFQNKNQFKSPYSQSFVNYSNEPGGQFSDDVRNVLRNQYKDLQGGKNSNYNYTDKSVSSYQPSSSLSYR